MIEGLIIDCFAGGGGASKGIEEALGRPIDIAVNHDPEAIRMHKVNHPNTLHSFTCENCEWYEKHWCGLMKMYPPTGYFCGNLWQRKVKK